MIFEAIDVRTLEGDREWWAIYEEALPREEREPRQVILGSLRDGVGMALRARDGDRTVGLSTLHLLVDPPAAFMVYLAVEGAARRRGVGAALLQRTWELSLARTMVWEVDMPSRADSPTEEARRRRRISFFQRCGGRLLARAYAQPPLDGGTKAVPMHLMLRSDEPLDEPAIERLVRAVYFEKYGAVNGIDRALLSALLAHPHD